MKKIALSVVVVFLMATTVFAGHPLVSDDAGTVGKGSGEVEIGVSFFNDKVKVDDFETVRTEGGEVTLGATVGLLDNLDVVLEVPYAWFSEEVNHFATERASGLSDISLNVKWQIFEMDGWALAVKPGVVLPSGNEDEGLGAGRATYHAFVIGTKEFDRFALHANLGYIRNENNCDYYRDLWHASFAAEVEVIENLRLMANVGIERNPEYDSNKHPAFVLAGIAYDVSEMFTLSAGVKYGITDPEPDWTYLAGVTLHF